MFNGVILSEAQRILRRCPMPCIANKQLAFFRTKLLARGYDDNKIVAMFRRARGLHNRLKHARRPKAVLKQHFFKVQHSSTLDYSFVRRHIKQIEPLLSDASTVRTAVSVQRSVFRLLYKSQWRYRARGGRV